MFTGNKKNSHHCKSCRDLHEEVKIYNNPWSVSRKKIEGEGSLVVREQCLVGKEVSRNVFNVYTIVVNTEV